MITMVGTPSATLSNVAVPVIAVVVVVIAPISIVIPIRVVLPVVLIVDVVVITVVTISIASCLVIGVCLLERWGGWLGSMIRRWRHCVRHERYLGTSWTAHVRNLRVHLVEIYR